MITPDSTSSVSPTPVLRLPELRVEADRLARARLNVPLATTVIDRQSIERSGALNLGEILRPQVGVRVAALGGLGSFSPISIRGSSNDQVVVMVDGRRLNAAQGGGVDLADIPLDGLDRIEVVRGGASALHGPDAIGGVINLVTRDAPLGSRHAFRAEFGSFGTRLMSGRLARGGDGVDLRLNGRLLLSDGDYPFQDPFDGRARRANGRLDSRALDGALVLRPGWASRLELRGSHLQAEKGIPGPTQFPSPTATQWDRIGAIDLELRGPRVAGLERLLARGGTRLRASVQRQTRRYNDPDAPLGAVADQHRNVSVSTELRQDRALAGGRLLTVGADLRRDHLVSTSDGDRRRLSGAVWTRPALPVRSGRGRIIPALRYDAVQGFGGRLSPKLLSELELSAALTARASLGRSFRPPSFDDLFQPARASAAGNPTLRPEVATDADLGLTWRRGGFSFGATGFWNRIEDLIQWQPGAGGIWRPHNVEGARILGLELETAGALPLPGDRAPLQLQANLTLLDPRDAGSDRNSRDRVLPYRARTRANLQLRWPTGPFQVESQWRATGRVFVNRANTRTLPGNVVGDLMLRWCASSESCLELQALNLTNAAYQDIRDYPVPGRQWRLTGSVTVAR